MRLHGAKELRARFKALRQVFKPLGRDWADRTVVLARSRVRVKTGKTKASIRRSNATLRKAQVVASHGARFLDKGTQRHAMQARRFNVMRFPNSRTGRPVFAKRVNHPGARAYPFMRVSAREALDSSDKVRIVIEQWNRAAPGVTAPGLGAGKGGDLGL